MTTSLITGFRIPGTDLDLRTNLICFYISLPLIFLKITRLTSPLAFIFGGFNLKRICQRKRNTDAKERWRQITEVAM